MPILNYTTKIDPTRTVGEIQYILAKAGAASVKVDYQGGEPVAVAFLAQIGERLVPFRLPADWEGVYRVISKDYEIPTRLRTREQAKRVAWRVVKDWVEAQMAFIQSGQASLAQLFLPHAVKADGHTLYEEIAADPRFLLGSGEE
jgi:hypothetical protein